MLASGSDALTRAKWVLGMVGLALVTLLCATPSAPAAVSDFEVKEYVEDFKVSAAQAEANLELQHRGAGIVNQLMHGLDESYAGVWFDNEAGEFVVPKLPETSGAEVEAQLKGARLGNDYRTSSATSSWSELEAAQARLNRSLDAQIDKGVAGVSLDPRTNSVVINQAQDATKADEAKADQLAQDEGVQVEVRERGVEDFGVDLKACKTTSPRFCDKPLRGGVAIGTDNTKIGGGAGGTALCTAAFKATGKIYGNRFLLTAGHCVVAFGVSHWASHNSNMVEHPIGSTAAATYPGGDWAAINANGSYWDTSSWPSMIAHYGANEEVPIAFEGYSFVGQYVCHTGNNSGTSCANVLQIGYPMDTDLGPIYGGILTNRVCTMYTDSGGPVFAGNTALGIFHGDPAGNPTQYGNCNGNEDYGLYLPIINATDNLGVTVGARVGGPPSAATNNATNVQGYQATANGQVYPNSVETKYRFEYGTTTGYGSAVPIPDGGAGHGAGWVGVSANLPNLNPVTTYHYRLVAHSPAGVSYGTNAQFTTPAAAPKATTEGTSDVKAGKATLKGKVNPGGAETKYRFEYGKTTAYGTSIPVPDKAIGKGVSEVSVSEQIAGIKGQTTYHYRLVAQNSKGTTYGSDKSFTTPDWRPAITTEGASVVDPPEGVGKATVKGKVNPRGFATTYRFEWGTKAEFEEGKYNNLIPVPDASSGSGESDVSVEATINGIKGKTTYHYRLVAENAEGKTTGAGKSFTTPDWRPGAGTRSPVGVGNDEATLVGRVLPEGFDTSYHFEWGTTTAYGNSVPVPDGEVGWGEEEAEVTEVLEGLEPLTTYHYRLVAESVEGTAAGYDETFTTGRSGFVADQSPIFYQGAMDPTNPPMLSMTHLGTMACTGFDLGAISSGPSRVLAVELEEPVCHRSSGDWDVEMNDCGLEFQPGYKDGAVFRGELAVGPPGCGPITGSAPLSCDIVIPPQTSLRATYQNKGEGDEAWVEIDVNANLDYTLEDGVACPDGTYSDGLLTGSWQLWATNVVGNPNGIRIRNDFEIAPSASTGSVIGVQQGGATLHGTVNPHFLETTYQFEYGTTTSYGSKAPVAPKSAGSDDKEIAVSQAIEGLEPATTYHYRVLATNEEGTTHGEDRTFTTWGAWSPQATPNSPAKPRTALNDVSCPSSTLCVAAGTDAFAEKGALQRWDGSKWSGVEGLGLQLAGKGMTAVSCPSTSSCVITPVLQSSEAPWVWSWNPGSAELGLGAVQTLSAPSGATEVKLNDVACTAANACTVVGSYKHEGKTKTLAERWNGTAWSIQTTPNPESGNAELLGVSCDSPSSCTAVGTQETKTLALRWNGTSWSSSSTPNPAGANESRLASVSCTSASFCLAAGHYNESPGANKKTLTERWDGSSWSVLTTPNPAENKGASLHSVSCTSSTACTAVGRWASAAGFGYEQWGVTEERTLALSWGGSEWQIQSTPNPEGPKLAKLNGVYCSASNACTAVGSAKTSSSELETVTLGVRYE